MKLHILVSLLMIWLAWAVVTSDILADSVVLVLFCGLLAVLALRPLFLWSRDSMDRLPVMEAFALAHIPAYLIPVLDGHRYVSEYPVETQAKAIGAVCVYLFSAQFAFGTVKGLAKGGCRFRGKFLDRVIADVREPTPFFVLLVFWWVVAVGRLTMVLGWLGGFFPPVYSAGSAAGLISTFYLFLALGRGWLKPSATLGLLVLVGSGLAVEFTGGFLIGGTFTILLASLGYSMGRKRVPLLSMLACFALLSILHAGKAEMRDRYWAPGTNWSPTRLNPLEVYSFWFPAGCANLFGTGSSALAQRSGVFDRLCVAHLMCLSVSETPDHLPYLRGQTYLQTPQLLIPRIFWPEMPRGSLPNETLSIYYGVQTHESVEHTAVSMGPIVEARANFGLVGVVLVGALFGVLFAIPVLLAAGRTEAQVGFLIGVLFLRVASNTEATLGPLLVSFTQTLVMAIPLFLLLSRPPGPRWQSTRTPCTSRPRLPVSSETTAAHTNTR